MLNIKSHATLPSLEWTWPVPNPSQVGTDVLSRNANLVAFTRIRELPWSNRKRLHRRLQRLPSWVLLFWLPSPFSSSYSNRMTFLSVPENLYLSYFWIQFSFFKCINSIPFFEVLSPHNLKEYNFPSIDTINITHCSLLTRYEVECWEVCRDLVLGIPFSSSLCWHLLLQKTKTVKIYTDANNQAYRYLINCSFLRCTRRLCQTCMPGNINQRPICQVETYT